MCEFTYQLAPLKTSIPVQSITQTNMVICSEMPLFIFIDLQRETEEKARQPETKLQVTLVLKKC
jgi:hypothetical protein